MSNIKKALDNRDKNYYDLTQKIISLFSDKLNKATQYFIKIDRDIFWVSIEFINGTQNFLYISGLLEVVLGDVVVINNVKIDVDEEFLKKNSTRTLVRVMLNIRDLEEKTPKELYDKIKEYYELASYMKEEDIIKILTTEKVEDLREILDSIPDAIAIQNEKSLTTKEESVVEKSYDFDKSLLSEDQIRQMDYHSNLSTNKN